MIRDFEREQLNRLTAKTLDQIFSMRLQEGLGCSMFEAEAVTNLVREVYFPWLASPQAVQAGQLALPWLASPQAVQAGQLALTVVSAEEPGHKPLSQCKMVPVVLTLYAGEEDHQLRLQHTRQGVARLRQQQLYRMAQEALDQGGLLTAEDFAFRIFNCGLRTISRDLRVQAVELFLKRYTFTQIQERIRHSLSSIANYVITFSIVVLHTRQGHTVDEIAFLMQISPALAQAYQELYEHYNIPEYQERLEEIIQQVKSQHFKPEQLAPPEKLKKGVPS
jgi:hypothetical protein